MTTTTNGLSEICSQLTEARRWCRTNPARVLAIADECKQRILKARFAGLAMPDCLDRIYGNLLAGCEACKDNPRVLEGYIDGALFELSGKGE